MIAQEKAERIKWIDNSNIIPEENLLIAAGLRDCLHMSPPQIADFFETYIQVSGARRKVTSLKAELAQARTAMKRPYEDGPKILPGSEEERLCFRIIEERTGLMGPDIVALYELNTPQQEKHAARYLDQESWTQDKLVVLGGLLTFCCNGDPNSTLSFMLKWLHEKPSSKYPRPSAIVASLKRTHPFLDEYVKTAASDNHRRKEFEKLFASKPHTKDWTIDSILAAYQRHGRIKWSNSDNQLLWAGLVRYCHLSWKEAKSFLEDWFERHLSTDAEERYKAPYSAIRHAKLSLQDVAPIDSSQTASRTEAFSKILMKKGWTIESVQEAAQRGDFSSN